MISYSVLLLLKTDIVAKAQVVLHSCRIYSRAAPILFEVAIGPAGSSRTQSDSPLQDRPRRGAAMALDLRIVDG